MKNAEYVGNDGFLQRDSVEHEEYAEAHSVGQMETEEQDNASDLMDKILDRDNLNRAYLRVKSNKGAPGIDGMTVDEALPWLKEHKKKFLESIRGGWFKPNPVRRKEIPKPDGGVRKLGIPTVIDRIVRQAIAQVLTPIYEPQFIDEGVCRCPHCRKRYAADMGSEPETMPVDVDFRNPAFVEFLHLRERWIGEFARFVTDTTTKTFPFFADRVTSLSILVKTILFFRYTVKFSTVYSKLGRGNISSGYSCKRSKSLCVCWL